MRTSPTARALVATLASALGLLACTASSSYGTGQSAAPNYPPGAWGPPGTPASTAPPPAPGAGGGAGPGGYSAAGLTDPINRGDLGFLRARAQTLYAELNAALGAGPRSRMAGIPLVVDDSASDVNAFAACTSTGKSLIAVTDGLFLVGGYLSRCAATDDVFGTRKTDEFIRFVAQNQRPDQPLAIPGPGFLDPNQDNDAAKLTRQHQIFDEQIAFVLAHEMAHHYLGHLPCTAGNVEASEIGAVLTSVVPAFNQVNETGADTAGTYNVLDAGKRATGYHYTERGGLLTMQFFAGMDQLSPIDLIFAFERSHPPPQIRAPIIQQTAASWRATGGAPLPWLL